MVLAHVRRALARRKLTHTLPLAEVPAFPEKTLRVLELLRDPDVEFDAIAEALAFDPGLSVRLLAIVNSAAYSPNRPIKDIRHGVTYLGRSELEQLVLAVAIKAALPATATPGFDSRRFWRTAAERAALSRMIAGELHPARAAEAFTAALLLDLAVPAMAHGIGPLYGEVLREWHESPDLALHGIESSRLATTHLEVGRLLGEAWELPSELVSAIAGHHDLSLSDDELLPSVKLTGRLRETDSSVAHEAMIEHARSDYGLEPDWMLGAIERSVATAAQAGVH